LAYGIHEDDQIVLLELDTVQLWRVQYGPASTDGQDDDAWKGLGVLADLFRTDRSLTK